MKTIELEKKNTYVTPKVESIEIISETSFMSDSRIDADDMFDEGEL